MTKICVLNAKTGKWMKVWEGRTRVALGLADYIRDFGFRVKTGLA